MPTFSGHQDAARDVEEADKENCPLITNSATISKPPLASASIGSSSSSPKTPLESVLLAFPSEDPHEDPDVLLDEAKTLRSKRSALFYPSASLKAQCNQKPFSHSAVRRESIMALGSIGYLQHLYTKQGIASKKRPLTKAAMTLAIGRAGETMVLCNAGDSDEVISAAAPRDQSSLDRFVQDQDESGSLDLPPSPVAGTYARPKYLGTARPLEADMDALLALLKADVASLIQMWGLTDFVAQDRAVPTLERIISEGPDTAANKKATAPSRVDVLAIIDVTTNAIRSVRSYLLASPRRSVVPSSSPNEPSGRDRFRRQASFSGVSRPGQVGAPVPTRTSEILHHIPPLSDASQHSSGAPAFPVRKRTSSTHAQADDDHLGIVRKAALEMLAALKEMERRYRTESIDGSDSAHESCSAGVASGDDPDESSFTVLQKSIPQTGYLYRNDLELSDFAAERKVLQSYLTTVDSVLASLMLSSQRWLSSSADALHSTDTLNSSGSATPQVRVDAADTLGPYSSSYAWVTLRPGATERLSSFLIEHCEPCGVELSHRRERIRSAADESEKLLTLLADGYLLCRAFNEAIRRSVKPWGYIAAREMHDLEAEEAALLHKETLRAKEAVEAESKQFQTRTSRISPSGGISNASTVKTSSVEGEKPSRPGWTFRKTENLRVWAAALKLRYQIQTTATQAISAKPKAVPTYGSLGLGTLALHGRRAASESHAATADHELRSSSKTIDFDPSRIARKDPGWQEMLTTLVHAWIDAVAHEQAAL